MFCCYRGTKMEIQGLTDTLNTQRQHGVLLQRAFSPQGTVSVIHASSRLDERENSDHSGSLGVESVDDNSRARSSPLGPVEHGSRCFLSVSDTGVIKDNDHPELSNVTVEKQKQVIEINLLSSGLEGADEHEHSDMREVALPFVHTERNAADQGFANNATSPEQLYVVFNVVHKDNDSKERPSFQSKAEENGSSDTLSSTRESDENISSTSSKSTHLSSHSSTERTDMTKCFRHDICLETEIGDPMLTENYLGSRYMPKVSTANTTSDQLISLQQATDDLTHCLTKNSPAFVPENRVASEMSIKDYTGQESAPDETPVSVHETFSGTIMINNQSIIVTIENGILTLAAPPEGCAYKEDGVMSLKEHLGMKDNEDLVLLNYDGGSKSIGKISNFTTSSQDEPKASLVCSDSELTLADGCSLPKMDVTLNSCPSIKQEEGVICTVDAANNVCQNSKSKPATFEDDLQPINHFEVTGLTKKGSVVKYRCPQLGCSSTFDTRQNLKIHLVVHSEDQRPFKCTVEGCGWSFTTSYKLKRHLQSHDKVRPYKCEWENCGRHFTTVYNLKAHVKAHDQENAFVCEVCNERFRTATRLANHQRSHFEPERPHKCEFPGCEKTFITFSALFSHNRTHFRELGQFTCTYPGCDKRYDKACRLKIHLRSHTGERPFICDSDSCGWTFTSMSKLLRHKRKHDDDRRFTCPEEGCGKSFTRAEHLKGHSITHLGTKPFECHVEGCNAKFSARSSLYIHSKKHRQDGVSLRSRCPVAGCTKHFSSRSSVKTHMLKHHNLSPDVLSQLESTPSLTPSSELTSSSQMVTGAPGPTGTELGSLDLSSLFSSVPTCPGSAAVSVGPIGTSGSASFSMDMSLVNTGILTIDPASVGSTLNGAKTIDPLILATGQDIGVHVLDTGLGTGGGGGGVLSQATLHLDDVQTVNPEELGTLTALAIQSTASSDQLHSLSSSNTLTVESPSTFTPSLSSSLTPSALPSSLIPSLPSSLSSSMVHTGTSIPKLLTLQTKAELAGSEATMGPLLSSVEVRAQTNGSKGLCQYVFHSHSGSYNGQKNTELPSVTTCPTMESSGSARTDYRAIQLAKRRKQKCPESSCVSETGQTKSKGSRDTSSTLPGASSAHFGEGTATGNGDLPIRDPVTGAQFVQIQLLQDDPAAVGDLAFQLSSQSSCSHSQLTVDLPVNILQEPTTITEDENGSDNSQFTGSTINLQDLE